MDITCNLAISHHSWQHNKSYYYKPQSMIVINDTIHDLPHLLYRVPGALQLVTIVGNITKHITNHNQ